MSVEHADSNWLHLYPKFADALHKILAQADHETTGKHGVDHWVLFEGLRTQARQDYLFTLGRTRVNPDGKNARHPMGNIVTKTRASKHKNGMAADCYPVNKFGDIMWDAHSEIWAQFGHCVRSQPNMEWGGEVFGSFKDQPHVQPKATQRLLWAAAANRYLKGLGLI